LRPIFFARSVSGSSKDFLRILLATAPLQPKTNKRKQNEQKTKNTENKNTPQTKKIKKKQGTNKAS